MTIQAIEQFDSRSSRGTEDKPTAERRFRVYDDAGTATVTEDQAIHASGIPEKYDRHPGFPWLRATWPPEVKQVTGKSYAWDLIFRYERLPSYVPDPGDENPNEVGYTEINTSSKNIWVDGWRANARLPTGEQINYPWPGFLADGTTSTDIGGASIDSHGEPASYPVTIMLADITHIVEGTPQFAFYAKFQNTRNKTTYLGAAPGKLLYAGNDSKRTGDNLWTVIHHFAYDEDYHLRQQPLRGDDGRVHTSGRTYTPPDGTTKAYLDVAAYSAAAEVGGVYHIQPYPGTMDFAVLRLRIR